MDSISIYLWAALLGWFSAHLVKFILMLVATKGKQRSLRIFLRSGGMPSSHTAIMIALLTVMAARDGINSAVFGLGAALTAIIIYDALNVRRSVGQQGDVLKKLAAAVKIDNHFFIAYGHTATEVVGGAIVGLLAGLLLLQIL